MQMVCFNLLDMVMHTVLPTDARPEFPIKAMLKICGFNFSPYFYFSVLCSFVPLDGCSICDFLVEFQAPCYPDSETEKCSRGDECVLIIFFRPLRTDKLELKPFLCLLMQLFTHSTAAGFCQRVRILANLSKKSPTSF